MTPTEKYFRAIGCKPKPHAYNSWNDPAGKRLCMSGLPDITQSFADFKLHVLEKMEGEKFSLNLEDDGGNICWRNPLPFTEIWQDVIDNEILEAAVVAATRYFEEKK